MAKDRLVRNPVGYNLPKIDITETPSGQRAVRIIKDYNDFLLKQLETGKDLTKLPSFKTFVNKKYPGTYKSIADLYNVYRIPEFEIPTKDNVRDIRLRQTITEANKGLKFLSIDEVLKKSKSYPSKLAGFASKYSPLLESKGDKVRKAFDEIVNNDEVIAYPKNVKKGTKYIKNPLQAMIFDKTGVGGGGNYISEILRGDADKPKLYKLKNNYPRELLKLAGTTGVIEFEKPYSEILSEAKYREGGGLVWSQRNVRPDAANSVNDFALRHWDYHNRNKTGRSQIQFYYKKNNEPVVYDEVPKDKFGRKKGLKTSEVYFTYDKDPNNTKWDMTKLRKEGKGSGLFDEVYAARNEYNKLLSKKVPDPVTGKSVTFEDLMKRTYKKGFNYSTSSDIFGIDHEKLIAEKPFNALRITNQRLNNQLGYISKFAKQKNFKNILTNALDLKQIDDPLTAGQDLARKVLVEGYKTDLTAPQEMAQTVLKKDLKKLSRPMVNQLVNLFSRSRKEEVVRPILEAADVNAGQICQIVFGKGARFGKQLGGSGQGCAVEMANVLENEPEKLNKLTNLEVKSGPLAKVKNAALGFLRSPGFKTFSAAGVAGAIGSAIVKEFRNDDPTTYLSNEDQQKNMLVAMATDPITTELPRPDILDYQLPLAGALAAGSIAATAPKTIEASKTNLKFASRAPGVEKKKPGIIKTGFRTLGRGLGVAASPGLLAPLAAMDITRQISEGDSPVDIATDPLNYLYPAFAEQTPKLTRGLPAAARKIASLGLGRLGLTILSRAGLAGLGLSLGIQGYKALTDD